jgi:hypothetical protein
MTRSRVVIFPLFKDLTITSNGSPGSKTTLDLDVPGIRNLLPQAEALFLITSTVGLATTGIMEWNVTCYSGFDRSNQPLPAFDISGSVFNVDGSKRSSDYTATATFMLDSRLQLWWQNFTGVTGPRTAVIGAALGVRLYGS